MGARRPSSDSGFPADNVDCATVTMWSRYVIAEVVYRGERGRLASFEPYRMCHADQPIDRSRYRDRARVTVLEIAIELKFELSIYRGMFVEIKACAATKLTSKPQVDACADLD